MNTNQRKQTR